MSVTAIHLVIHGRVQGVGYRAWTSGTAKRLGLNGWVRNRRDGTVEALLIGEEDAIATMRTECLNGPMAAKVEKIDERAWNGERPSGFEQLPTL